MIQSFHRALIAFGFAACAAASADAGLPRSWVFFRGKGVGDRASLSARTDGLKETYNPRAIQRRTARRTAPGLFDLRDLPVSAAAIHDVEATGARVHVESRWLNAVSVEATPEQLAKIVALPEVSRVEPVRGGHSLSQEALNTVVPLSGDSPTIRSFYGYAEAQIAQVGVLPVHAQNFTASGVIIGILDTGFYRVHEAFNQPSHPLQVVAEHDFINNDGNTGPQPGDPGDQHMHGTLILGTLGAYLPDVFVGTAYNASFILCKTEDVSSETPVEEDNYVAGLEFIEANGGDMATSSLGYIDWYTQADLDGQTAVTTIAVNVATENGVHCCTAAGNSGHDGDPATSHLIAPADALRVFTCGAVNSSGTEAGFSSDGPSADGRVKPEVLARGVETVSVAADGSNGYWAASGTSLSTPMVAGVVACLTGARPDWTVEQMRDFLMHTAGDYVINGIADPTFVRGYGIVNAAAALARDCNANGVDDAIDISSGESADCNGNGLPDECECAGDLDRNCDVGLTDLAQLLSHFGLESGATYADGDLNHDHQVDLTDLALMLARFGSVCR
ncbi:MAG: S8 family serine peptidase [Planctomycetes bacterium]|nr:S8 family serine peptidase [Planctomycetota bacterium]